MVPEKVKAELKRFLSSKQVEEISKQLDVYEKRVREAVRQFDVKGREAKEKGQEHLDKFAAQLKRTGHQLEKQFKAFVNTEGKALNRGLNELFTYFRGINGSAAVTAKPKKTSTKKKSAKRPRTAGRQSAHASA